MTVLAAATLGLAFGGNASPARSYDWAGVQSYDWAGKSVNRSYDWAGLNRSYDWAGMNRSYDWAGGTSYDWALPEVVGSEHTSDA